MRGLAPVALALVSLPLFAILLMPKPAPAQQRASVGSWAYQLDGIEPDRIARSGFELVVIDYSADGSAAEAFSRSEVEAMRRMPDGGPRRVVAYMSIGEAEEYRFYWQKSWRTAPPAWLDDENPDWPGNYKVRFWEPSWQAEIFGNPEAYLDLILEAGFEGVYLDIIDAFEYYEDTRPEAEREMVDFVRSISEYAKSKAGNDFLVIPQNGERLLEHEDYVAAIDGIAKEDLFWGYESDDAPTPSDETEFSIAYLQRALDRGKFVLTVDYPPDPVTIRSIYTASRARGFVPYAADRDLDQLRVNAELDPEGSVTPSADFAQARRLPGQFFALTAPKGVARVSLTLDRWSERYRYYAEDLGGTESQTSYVADEYAEWTTALRFGYGLTDRWEIGVVVPVADGHFVRSATDGLSGLPTSFDQRGLGNLRLFLAGSQSWHDGDANVLGLVEFAPPTDSRGAPFSGSDPELRLSITAERYWGSVGLVSELAGTSYFADELGDSELVGEVSVGVGAQLAPPLFLSAMLTRSGSDTRSEVAAEALLTERISLEAFIGRDLAGPAEATFFGFATSLWIGGGS